MENYDSIDDFFPDADDFLAMMTPKSNSKIPDFNSIAENALKQRADLKIAKQQVDVAQKNLSVVVRQRIP